jgi:hypothetical protein
MSAPSTEPRSSDPALAQRSANLAQRHALYLVAACARAESGAGVGATLLASAALFGFHPLLFASISALMIGAGLELEGMTMLGRYAQASLHDARRTDSAMSGGGTGAQLLAGAAAGMLGGLALAGVNSWTLLSIASVVAGGALLLSASERAAFVAHATDRSLARRAVQALRISAALMGLSGFIAFAVGILAWSQAGSSHAVVSAALSCAGAAHLLGGSALLRGLAT